MANVIKHKRGSGSDPGASDLVVGEVAIRTDVGKLFTKMDNGSVAEIAGGGSDIAINTLSSSGIKNKDDLAPITILILFRATDCQIILLFTGDSLK